MKPIAFAPRSNGELWDAIDYYHDHGGGRVVTRFRQNYKAICERICLFPYLFGKVDRRHRAAPIRRFPFAVIYRVRRDRIEVVSIHHVRKARISI